MSISRLDLTALEDEFVRFQLAGQLYAPLGRDDDVDPTWGDERTIRADVLRTLVLGAHDWNLTANGLQLACMRIEGDLDLKFIATLPPLQLVRCLFTGAFVVESAATPNVDLTSSRASRLAAARVRVGGSMRLDGFQAASAEFDLADIGGALVCSGAQLEGPDTALSADGATIGSDVLLDRGFVANGAVGFRGASIGGRLDCRAGTFNDQDRALDLAQSRIRSHVVLSEGARAAGAVVLSGADIGGELYAADAQLEDRHGAALVAEKARIEAGVYLDDEFEAKGGVSLRGARIDGQLRCGGTIAAEGAVALDVREAEIAANVILRSPFRASGEVRLDGATIGGSLTFSGAELSNPGEVALRADGVTVRGYTHLTDHFTAAGLVRFVGADIGGEFSCREGSVQSRHRPAVNLDRATIRGEVSLGESTIAGDLSVRGATLREQIDVDCDADQVQLSGARFEVNTRLYFASPLALDDIVVRGPLSLVPRAGQGAIPLRTLAGATLEAPLVIPDGVTMKECRLRNVIGLEHLQIVAGDPGWPRWRRRRILPDEAAVRSGEAGGPSATEVEGAYRQLRAALEASKAAPAAADFYYGEMEMRRLAAPRPSFDRALLLAYKVTSGYGLHAWRAILSYTAVILAVAGALYLDTETFVNDEAAAAGRTPAGGGLSFDSYGDVVALVARSSVSFLSPTTSGLTAWGTALLILVRFAAPVFLALTVLAVRARVQR
jgi:hypothetical protein